MRFLVVRINVVWIPSVSYTHLDVYKRQDVLIESRERNAFMSKELQIRSSTVDFLVFTRDAGEDGIEVRRCV